ncbi:MAG: alcohol dehydrogenase catalytic domain-containing protein [Thermoguttaceae bacterium]
MKAIVYHAPGDIRVDRLPDPACSERELLVRVDACAVCGTDLKTFRHGNPRIEPPLTMGHEFTGRVVEAGTRAAGGFAPGDRIVMATSISCGRCFYCRRGWTNLCVSLAPMGFTYPGGMAELVVIPAQGLDNGHVVKTPADMPARHAALAEPVSCAVNSIEQCQLEPGATVLVLGAGPLGLMNACVARALGAGKIILSEVSPPRLAQARAFEIDVLVNPAEENLAGRVMAETGGLGADVAVVAAPAAQPQEQAVHLVRKRGTVVLFASLPKDNSTLRIDSRAIHYGELRVIGSSDSTAAHVRRAIDLLASGRVPAAKLATHTLPLDEIHKAFELMSSGEALRVVVEP